jgi:quercetin dioxygenase-like cupin family protein
VSRGAKGARCAKHRVTFFYLLPSFFVPPWHTCLTLATPRRIMPPYGRPMCRILLPDKLSSAIVNALMLRLTAQEQQQGTKHPPLALACMSTQSELSFLLAQAGRLYHSLTEGFVMKRFSSYFVLVLVGLFFFGATVASAQKKTEKEAVLWAAEDLKWVPLSAGVPGVMSVMLWGDNTKGAYAGLTKFPAGFKAPLHYHTNATKIVVIKGAYTYNGKKYGPGSYVYVPGGVQHVSGGVEDSESIFFIEQPGKFDLNPVEPAQDKK